ncbi:MAG: phosphatase PAP2 family protein [Candidatus Omnitrophica bacterium]|nr:phosphatase PAP2 family protein [Candidatus Omnitrophota bacterium]MBU1047231.1 phosphatase PAP2 family protein [Candidatus Omnitrophota bacterium]MBU1631228.1 phosphatase PAP2 family protein [Candidatus Omnitrophota bacterium]MBU1889183.1 phosphatase PAP2 family protein [Candidatus Omnitrophota bacterium]
MMDILINLNHNLFLFLNQYNFPLADKLMLLITSTGNGLVLITFILIALAIFDRKKMLRVFLSVLLAGIVGGIVVHLLKLGIDASRPLVIFPDAHFLGEPLKMGSFPSGHTQLCFSTAVILAKEYKKNWKLFYLWAFIVGYSRIYVGAHFPMDIIAGGIIGYLSGKFIVWYNWLLNKELCEPSNTKREENVAGNN